jgi:hypothetical protein
MNALPCLTLFRAGYCTLEIARLLNLRDEACAYNRLAAERDFEAGRGQDPRGAWMSENAARLRGVLEDVSP